jgi:hypothetical protein
MERDREELIGAVTRWLDVESKNVTREINPDHLRRLEEALKIAQTDREAIKRARRRRSLSVIRQ